MSDTGLDRDAGAGLRDEESELLLAARRVGTLLEHAAAQRPEATYARLQDGTVYTIGEVCRLVDETATELRAYGVGAGDRVAVGMSNSIDHVVAILALFSVDAVWLPLNPRLRGVPLTHVLSDCRPAYALIGEGSLTGAFVSSCGEIEPAVEPRWLGRILEQGVEVIALDHSDDVSDHPDGLRAVMYTSGTTGAPKGVMVTDALLLASVAGCLRVTECRPGDVFYIWEPIHHIGGAQVLLLPFAAEVSLALGPAFDRRSFWSDLAASGATHFHYLGGILQMLLKEPPSPAERSHAARIGWGAGATPEIWAECERRFGVALHECYGATETSSIVTVNTIGPEHGVGQPVPWFEIRVDPSDRASVGELQVRPRVEGLVTPGYWRNPAATAAATDGSWWRTGDLARTGECGEMHFIGRVADGIRVRGENLSAWQIESTFDTHPDVGKSAVVGVDSEYGEQDLLLFLQPTEGRAIDIPRLAHWAAERLPTLYQPRYAKIVDSFELTPSRRVRKTLLDRSLDDCVEFRSARSS